MSVKTGILGCLGDTGMTFDDFDQEGTCRLLYFDEYHRGFGGNPEESALACGIYAGGPEPFCLLYLSALKSSKLYHAGYVRGRDIKYTTGKLQGRSKDLITRIHGFSDRFIRRSGGVFLEETERSYMDAANNGAVTMKEAAIPFKWTFVKTGREVSASLKVGDITLCRFSEDPAYATYKGWTPQFLNPNMLDPILWGNEGEGAPWVPMEGTKFERTPDGAERRVSSMITQIHDAVVYRSSDLVDRYMTIWDARKASEDGRMADASV